MRSLQSVVLASILALVSQAAFAQLNGWCGLGYTNAGNYPSITRNGSTANSALECFGHDPRRSCPRGYARAQFAMTSWHADSIADTAYTCIEFAPAIRITERSGEWCGLDVRNPGNRASIYLDGQVHGSVTCDGQYPSQGCPNGYDRVALSMTSWHDDSIADTIFTCVQNRRAPIGTGSPQGAWCGGYFVNSGTYPSINAGAQVPCLGESPARSCPFGFHKLQFCMTAWHADSIADCITTCVLD